MSGPRFKVVHHPQKKKETLFQENNVFRPKGKKIEQQIQIKVLKDCLLRLTSQIKIRKWVKFVGFKERERERERERDDDE